MSLNLTSDKAQSLKKGISKLKFSFVPPDDYECDGLELDYIYTFNGVAINDSYLRLEEKGNRTFRIDMFSRI